MELPWLSLLQASVFWPLVIWIIITKLMRSRKQPEPTPTATATEVATAPTADSSQLASLSTHLTSMMLPPFWPEQPEAWFTNVESQFLMTNTADEATRFQRIICKLPPEITGKVIHITCKPFEAGDYFKLKETILGAFTKSRTKRWQELLALSNVQNMKPSAILSKLRTLTSSTNPDECINIEENDMKLHFLRALPSHMQPLFSVISKSCTIDELAKQADTYIEHSPTETNIAAVELHPHFAQTSSQQQPSNVGTQSNSETLWSSIAASLDAITSKIGNQGRITRNQRDQNRSQRQTASPQLCFYHKQFGDRARKCAGPPCSKNM